MNNILGFQQNYKKTLSGLNSVSYDSIDLNGNDVQNQLTTLQTKTTELNYSGSVTSFSNGVHFNSSNNQTNYKVLDIYDDGTNSVNIGCQYSGTNMVLQVSNTTYGCFSILHRIHIIS
jgi:hypothetical protein